MRLIASLFCALLASSAGAAEIYKWVDEKGRTQYSDRPPPANVEIERRDLPENGNDGAAPSEGASAEAQSEAAAETPASDPCSEARRSLQRLEQDVTVRMDLDGDGTPEVLSAAARLEQIEIARQNLAQRCGGEGG